MTSLNIMSKSAFLKRATTKHAKNISSLAALSIKLILLENYFYRKHFVNIFRNIFNSVS